MMTSLRWVLIAAVLICITVNPAHAQAREIPVFPGATLEMDPDNSDDDAICCDFFTPRPFGEVISFYEQSFGAKSLDAASLALQYPAMKPNLDALARQMPPSMKIRFFVLEVVQFNGNKLPTLFEVISNPDGTRFSIEEGRLSKSDARHERERESAIDVQALKAVLPKTLPQGFTRYHEETIDDGIHASYTRTVRKASGAVDDQDDIEDIVIAVTDHSVNDPEYAAAMLNGWKERGKPFMAKGKYEGSREVTGRKGYFTEIVFPVKNRYLIEVRGHSSAINKFIDLINPDVLPD
jgi:hypothetical protein